MVIDVFGEDSVSSSSENNDDNDNARKPAIFGISSQGYNAVMHNTRGRSAQHHEVQVGYITRMLAGSWMNAKSHQLAAQRWVQKCQQALPHEAYAEKIRDRSICRDLRLENVYYIDLDALNPGQKRGSEILNQIILPLGAMWLHASLWEKLPRHVVLFEPDAYPAVYNWTTYPITALLDIIYRSTADAIKAKTFSDTFVVELCSVLERTLNYMHTGNASVIATTVMNPMWIGRAIVQDGLPCLNPQNVMIQHPSKVHISHQHWPYDRVLHLPYSSSRKSQVINFGKHHFNECSYGGVNPPEHHQPLNNTAIGTFLWRCNFIYTNDNHWLNTPP
ncbi:hypothetical protein BD779DRAFT_1477818 [Infundibulicybe gibba]|nr:hypothetical protein BD779DRAFT_1477818 [Infundibulicybe gibba]